MYGVLLINPKFYFNNVCITVDSKVLNRIRPTYAKRLSNYTEYKTGTPSQKSPYHTILIIKASGMLYLL